MQTYKEYLDADVNRAFLEGSMHFEKDSKVHITLRRITEKLDELGIPYAIAGAMALFYHGYRRFTEDVDLIVTREDLKRIHEELEGLGYVPVFKGSKALRDTTTGVKVDFMITGDYPGDGKPKPVSFPSPVESGYQSDGTRYLSLAKLLELKLASGLHHPPRMKDITDVYEAIKVLGPDERLSETMNPYVRDKYLELLRMARENTGEDY